ncbi:uncharacterized protein LOC135488381 [Lineus longissimus]|uniref:uncharacterized protein LOC135488381 n=1 Tax=Lineus longissimus TaxID=88925 RepID=UPI00315DA8E0
MDKQRVRFAKDSFGVYAAEQVQETQPEQNGQAAYVDAPSPSHIEPDTGQYHLKSPPKDPRIINRKGVKLSSIEEVPEEENLGKGVTLSGIDELPEETRPRGKGVYAPEPVEKAAVHGNQFPSTAEEIPEKELAADSRFLEVEPYCYKKKKPGDFSKSERVLPPIRRGLGAIDEVGPLPERERTDDLDRTYEALQIDRPEFSDLDITYRVNNDNMIRPEFSDLDITYRVNNKTSSNISPYGLTHSVIQDRKPNFSDLDITFSPEPLERKNFDRPLTHALEPAPIDKPRRVTKPYKLEPAPNDNPRKVTRPYKLEPLGQKTKRASRAMSCAVESVAKPQFRRQVNMLYPFVTEMDTKHGHTRRYDRFARVPEELSLPRQMRRGSGDMRTYRVVGVEDDWIGDLPDELDHSHTIDTPQITELDSFPSGSLGSEITLGEGTQDDILGRWERISIPGTIHGSQGTFNIDIDGPSKPSEERWELVSLTATLAGSRGTLNIDDAERLYGKPDRSKRSTSNQDRWERTNTEGTLKGSLGTIHEDGGQDGTGKQGLGESASREQTNLSGEGTTNRESRKGSTTFRSENVSLPDTLKGSCSSVEVKPVQRRPSMQRKASKIPIRRASGARNGSMGDEGIQGRE